MKKTLEMKNDGHDSERFSDLLRMVVSVPKAALTETPDEFADRVARQALENLAKPRRSDESHEEFGRKQIEKAKKASGRAETPPPPPRRK